MPKDEGEKVKQSFLFLVFVWLALISFWAIIFGTTYMALPVIWKVCFPLSIVGVSGAVLTFNKTDMTVIDQVFMFFIVFLGMAILFFFVSFEFFENLSEDYFITAILTIVGAVMALRVANFVYRLIKC